MDATFQLASYVSARQPFIAKVVDFDLRHDHMYSIDLTKSNPELSFNLLADTAAFDAWVSGKLQQTSCRYAIGGYMERRAIYESRSHFSKGDEARSIHLGVDIWAEAGRPVYAPLDGSIHSYQDNNNFGDYGPTIILQHDMDGFTLYSLYGHLNRDSLAGLAVGQQVKAGQQIAQFGTIDENGHWPPHLHFQLMLDMEGKRGDYPGVCRPSEQKTYLQNIPDPNILLQFAAGSFV